MRGGNVRDQDSHQPACQRGPQRVDLARARRSDHPHRYLDELVKIEGDHPAVDVVIDLQAVLIEEPAADVADHAVCYQPRPFLTGDVDTLAEIDPVLAPSHAHECDIRSGCSLEGLRDRRVGETTAEQTAVALENITAILAEAGAGLEDVVRCGVYLDDMTDFAEMNEAYLEKFSEPLPARTTVGVTLRGFKVEIDCVAVLPQQP